MKPSLVRLKKYGVRRCTWCTFCYLGRNVTRSSLGIITPHVFFSQSYENWKTFFQTGHLIFLANVSTKVRVLSSKSFRIFYLSIADTSTVQSQKSNGKYILGTRFYRPCLAHDIHATKGKARISSNGSCWNGDSWTRQKPVFRFMESFNWSKWIHMPVSFDITWWLSVSIEPWKVAEGKLWDTRRLCSFLSE